MTLGVPVYNNPSAQILDVKVNIPHTIKHLYIQPIHHHHPSFIPPLQTKSLRYYLPTIQPQKGPIPPGPRTNLLIAVQLGNAAKLPIRIHPQPSPPASWKPFLKSLNFPLPCFNALHLNITSLAPHPCTHAHAVRTTPWSDGRRPT